MNPTNHWKLGLFVVGGLLLGFAALAWFGAQRLNRESFPIVTYFGESVEGLDVGSPVKFRGVQLGRVQGITFAPNREDVQVTCEIYLDTVRRLGLRDSAPDARAEVALGLEGLRLQLVRSGITGVAYLEADLFDEENVTEVDYDFDTPWNFVPSQPSTLRSIETNLERSLNRLPELLTRADEALAAVSRAVDAAAVPELSAELRSTLEGLRGVVEEVRAAGPGALVDEARGAAAGVRKVTADLSRGTESLERSLTRTEELLGGVADDLDRADLAGTVEAVRGAARGVERTGRAGEELLLEARQELSAAGETLAALRRLLDLLERDPSSLLKGRR